MEIDYPMISLGLWWLSSILEYFSVLFRLKQLPHGSSPGDLVPIVYGKVSKEHVVSYIALYRENPPSIVHHLKSENNLLGTNHPHYIFIVCFYRGIKWGFDPLAMWTCNIGVYGSEDYYS